MKKVGRAARYEIASVCPQTRLSSYVKNHVYKSTNNSYCRRHNERRINEALELR